MAGLQQKNPTFNSWVNGGTETPRSIPASLSFHLSQGYRPETTRTNTEPFVGDLFERLAMSATIHVVDPCNGSWTTVHVLWGYDGLIYLVSRLDGSWITCLAQISNSSAICV